MNRIAWRRVHRRISAASVLAGALALGSCDNSSAPNLHVVRVEVNLAASTILLGTTAMATAHAFDLNGNEITGATASWVSDATSIVTVDKSGILTAHALGNANISATIGGVTASSPLTVVPLPVASVDITPGGGPLDRGQSLQLRANVRDQFGTLLTDRVVVWTTSAAGIASVSSNGVVNALAAGSGADHRDVRRPVGKRDDQRGGRSRARRAEHCEHHAAAARPRALARRSPARGSATRLRRTKCVLPAWWPQSRAPARRCWWSRFPRRALPAIRRATCSCRWRTGATPTPGP